MIVFFINYRSGVTLAIKDNNGTFLSTLSMQLYKVRPFKTFGRLQKNPFQTQLLSYFSVEQDQQYQQILTIPETGLDLKTKIYVSVKATNLTKK